MSRQTDYLSFLLETGQTEAALELLDEWQAPRVDEGGYKGPKGQPDPLFPDGEHNPSSTIQRWETERMTSWE